MIGRVIMRSLLAACALTALAPGAAAPALAQQTETRRCFGLIWCTEIKADGATATDGLLFLYSSERKGNDSRMTIRPFYAREDAPSRGYLRRSVLWPLGSYERDKDRVSSHVAPLYWHGEEPTLRYTLLLPLYFDYRSGERSYRHIIPLYGHHARGTTYDRYFILGPALILTRDTERDLRQWDALFFLGHHRSERGRGNTWVLPLYFSGYDTPADRSYRYLLPVYGRWHSPSLDYRFLFPIFGRETDPTVHEQRIALFGLPPLRMLDPLPTLALYEHRTSPKRVTDRFFPIYRYAHQPDEAQTEIDALLLYRHVASRRGTTDRLFPFYRYERLTDAQSLQLSVLGYQELSFASYHRDPSGSRSHVFPLFSDEQRTAGPERSTSVLGYGPLAVYRHQQTPSHVRDRMIPLYAYERAGDDRRIDALGIPPLALYHRHATSSSVHDRLFPLYDYEDGGDRRALSVLGLSEASLFRWLSTPTLTRHRLFPIYSYRHDRSAHTADIRALLVYSHHRDQLLTTDGVLGLYSYARDEQSRTRAIEVIGIPPITLYQHESSPSLTTDRFFPAYGYRSSTAGGTAVSALGFAPSADGITLALYEHRTSLTRVSDRVFPVYRYVHDRPADTTSLNVLGLYQHEAAPDHLRDILFPLYAVDRRGATRDVAVLGYGPISVFHYRDNGTTLSHRLFPLYLSRRDRAADDTFLNIAGLYWHVSTARSMSNGMFPLYGYRRRADESRLALLGLPPLGDFPALALYEHRASSTRVSDRVFPVYRYVNDRPADTTSLNVLGLYQHEVAPDHLRDTLFPLYSVDRRGATRDVALLGYGQVFVLHYRDNGATLSHRVFPLYLYRRDRAADKTFVNVAALYWHASSPRAVSDGFFPLYGYRRQADETRLALLGLPPLGDFPALALYEHRASSTRMSDRIFPLYRLAVDHTNGTTDVNALLLYAHHREPGLTTDRVFPLYEYGSRSNAWSLSVLGIGKWALYRHDASTDSTNDRFFPLYGYRRSAAGWTLGALGYPPLSLYQHTATSQSTTDRFVPLYSVRSDHATKERRIALLGLPHVSGLPTLSLYQHESSPRRTLDRFFPVYRYSHDLDQQRTRVGALLLFQASATPTETRHNLFPLYSYGSDRTAQVHRVGLFGYAPFSLYQHLSTPTGTSDRLLPLYTYSYDRGTTESHLSVLWPLFAHDRRDGRTTQSGLLWWLVHYESPDAAHRDFHILGGSAMALFRHKVTPERSSVEFNPILPLYYREVTPTATTWNVFGGLIGRTTSTNGTGQWRVLWVL